MASMESDGWAWLPDDLLGSILNKLVSFSDYVRCSVVCKSWLSFAHDHKLSNIKLYSSKQLPMLMIPTEDSSKEKRGLYSIMEGKIYESQLQVPYTRRCCGSSHGWIATVEENYGITLINPFWNRTIHLPPIDRAPVGDDDDESYVLKYEYGVIKVILSVDPCLYPDDYVVIAIYGEYIRLALIKSGDESWTYFKNEYAPFSDAIYCKRMLHVSNHYGGVLAIDISSSSRSRSTSSKDRGARPYKIKTLVPPPNNVFAVRAYIVESPEGYLWLAKRFLMTKDHDTQEVTKKFEVYKLLEIVESGQKKQQQKWVEVKTLDDHALFVGDNHSTSILASKYTDCRKNCIYFTDDYIDIVPYVPFGPRDIGMFNLEDGSIEEHYTLNPNQKHMPPAVWIVPTRANIV